MFRQDSNCVELCAFVTNIHGLGNMKITPEESREGLFELLIG